MMDNPYETPATQPDRKESRRTLWRRPLNCPHCQQPGISAGTAYLAHPFFKVRCNNCQRRSRVRLVGAARKRLSRLYVGVTIAFIWALAVLMRTGFMYNLVDETLLHLLGTAFTSLSLEWQAGIVLSLIGLISVTPLLALLHVATSVCLRDVAYHSTLIPADKKVSQ